MPTLAAMSAGETPYEVYFDTRQSLDEFADWLRQELNLAVENRSAYQLSQRREGANYGGLYYLFEVLGLELVLLANLGEVAIPERDDYSLYLIVGRSGDSATNLGVARCFRRQGRRSQDPNPIVPHALRGARPRTVTPRRMGS